MDRDRRYLKKILAKTTMKGACLEHMGAPGSHGYPQAWTPWLGVGTAPRFVWILSKGSIGPGVMVLHRCNNKKCVRLRHLYLGTHDDNMRDVAKTLAHPKRKLTNAQARKAKAMIADGFPERKIAKTFGISQRAVHYIKKGKTYRYD